MQRTCPVCYQHPGADGGYHEYCQNLTRSAQEQRQTGRYFLPVGSVTFIIHNLISCHSTNCCSCTGQLTTNHRSNTEEFLNSGQCHTSHGTQDLLAFLQESISLPNSELTSSSHTLTAHSFKRNCACVHQISLLIMPVSTKLVS